MGHVYVVAGMAFGDEGKGSVVDYLARSRQAGVVVRYNGGAQAAHNVVLPDGRQHTFSQFGSGTFAGARTHLSRFMLLNPFFLESEAEHLSQIGVYDPYSLLTVEDKALVTTPFHVSANRLRELLRDRKHGSCGMGIGETVRDSLVKPDLALRVEDFQDPDAMHRKLKAARLRLLKGLEKDQPVQRQPNYSEKASTEYEIFQDPEVVDQCIHKYRQLPLKFEIVNERYLQSLLKDPEKHLIFEGAQGVLLDEDYGFHPYTTWSHTTRKSAQDLLGKHRKVTWIGVFRSYFTRHGAGPFPSERDEMFFERDHNTNGPWQGSFRFGDFDMVLARYAQSIMKCDELAITCLDHLDYPDPVYLYKEVFPGVTDEEIATSKVSWDQLLLARQPAPPESDALAQALFKATPNPPLSSFNSPFEFFESLTRNLGAPVTLRSYGPTYQDKIEGRVS